MNGTLRNFVVEKPQKNNFSRSLYFKTFAGLRKFDTDLYTSVLRQLSDLQSSTKYIETFKLTPPFPQISMLKRQHIFVRAYCAYKTSTISLGVKILTFNVRIKQCCVGKTTLK